ncbi:MAG TPA: RsmB/NOP family class I SAM-dependent RNA methyltransferase [Burkholderiales bacterium]|nr:RsmB/NOP family class I SAM-dependent RNA methyltransferase [Burkholderiales bacterium]
MRLNRPLLAHAEAALATVLRLAGPADEALSRYFRGHRQLGQQDRAFVAESVFAVLRRRRSLELAAGSAGARPLLLAALLRVLGFSGRSLERFADEMLLARVRNAREEDMPDAVRADLPDWLWTRLVEQQGAGEATRIAQGLLNAAPLDLRVNLARISREEALRQLEIEAAPTPFSPSGIRLAGKPAVNRHRLFLEGLVEVQDEGSQILAWLLAPRRGEMVADYCAGAGGKTLALAMLMRGSGRVYALDISAKRLGALAPRAARAAVTNIYSIVLSGDNDPRTRRLAGKLDRVLVDAPCSGFGSLRRNPDLKWRHGPAAIEELAAKQGRILEAAARLLKPGGRLVYATCSILQEENEGVADAFGTAHPDFRPLSCAALLAAQRISLDTGERLRLLPHLHGTDGFFAAAFERSDERIGIGRV